MLKVFAIVHCYYGYIDNNIYRRIHLSLTHTMCTFDRSKSVNLDGSINNSSMHGNYTNVPIDLGSEWLFPENDLYRKFRRIF